MVSTISPRRQVAASRRMPFWPARLPMHRCSRRRDCRGCASACATSARRGTLSSVSVSSVRRLAIISGRAAFLAPEMGIVPFSAIAADDADAVHGVAPVLESRRPTRAPARPCRPVYSTIAADSRSAAAAQVLGGESLFSGSVSPGAAAALPVHRQRPSAASDWRAAPPPAAPRAASRAALPPVGFAIASWPDLLRRARRAKTACRRLNRPRRCGS